VKTTVTPRNRAWETPYITAAGDGIIAAATPHEEQSMAAEHPYEKTTRLTPSWNADAADYVKDTAEWVARCLARVTALDPALPAEEADKAVHELSLLERWRVMAPEAAAQQLYTPIKPRG
jgi:hypothetical protein